MEINFDLTKLNNKRVGVAVSGGIDSMALLNFLYSKQVECKFTLLAINIDHCMRDIESANDSKFVKEYCDKIGVPTLLFCAKDDGAILTSEEDARLYRYDCFNKAIKSGKCDLIATAHHKSDFVETALINLFRGSGASGLTGIKEENGYIVRPFIYTEKAQIDEYVKRENVPFVTDSTNLKSDYTRNFLRLNVIPLIKEKFPQLENNVQKFATVLNSEDEFLNGLATALISEDNGDVRVRFSSDRPIVARAFIIALKLSGIKKDYEKKHVDLLCDLLYNGETGNELSLINGVTAIKEYDGVVLYKKSEERFAPCPVSTGNYAYLGNTLTIESIEKAQGLDLLSGDCKYIDADKIPPTAVIRTRLDGDRFKTFSGNTKKLKDYFIDEKVPKRHRDELLLIADGKDVLYIAGKEISITLKVDENSKKIYRITTNK